MSVMAGSAPEITVARASRVPYLRTNRDSPAGGPGRRRCQTAHRFRTLRRVNVRSRARDGIAYYTAADARFFPGLVGLLNSLRLTGAEGPLFVVDCGLTEDQRRRLTPLATLVPTHKGLHPRLQKATGPLAYPAELMVIIDSDILVTRPLDTLLTDAARGAIVGFEDKFYPDRTFGDWASLGVGTPKERPYVNCGLLVMSAATGEELLPVFVELQERFDQSRADFGGAPTSTQTANPFYFGDQDILNALFSSRFDGRVVTLEARLAPVPPFEGLELLADAPLSCAYADGVVPYALHHTLEKPWLSLLEPNAYSEIFSRVLAIPESPLRLGRGEIPLRLAAGRLASVARAFASARRVVRRRIRGKLGLRPAIERNLRQRARG